MPIKVLTLRFFFKLCSLRKLSVTENWRIPCHCMFRLIDCNWPLLSGILWKKRKQDEFGQLLEFWSTAWICWGESCTWFMQCCLHSKGATAIICPASPQMQQLVENRFLFWTKNMPFLPNKIPQDLTPWPKETCSQNWFLAAKSR